jgi:hypothetical protein
VYIDTQHNVSIGIILSHYGLYHDTSAIHEHEVIFAPTIPAISENRALWAAMRPHIAEQSISVTLG